MTAAMCSVICPVICTVICTVICPAAAAADEAEAPSVVLLRPVPGEAVFGEVEIIAEVAVEGEIRHVWFLLDDALVGELTEPPYRLRVEVGDSNREHRFEVLAEDAAGRQGRALLVTPKLDVDLELDLELMQLYVTVERRHQRVLDREATDFAVYDDGEPQRLVTFERGDVPLTAVLLVDASDSMRGERLAAALAGAETFIAGMQDLDQAKLLLFADRVVHGSPFTNFAEVLATGLEGVEAGGSTALNDHLYLSLKLLDQRQGRRVVILLSDGIDVTSVLRMREVLETVRRSQALIYWLRLGSADPTGGQSSAWRDAGSHREELELLEAGGEASGGRILVFRDVTETAAAFAEILSELRQQYVLGFYPSRNFGDDKWHEIRVRVNERGLKVRTRQGYVDF